MKISMVGHANNTKNLKVCNVLTLGRAYNWAETAAAQL